jgi:Asp-tRNA(Asn)/Glu-tRNA(Gln) amidotransferase A subunit family amidase
MVKEELVQRSPIRIFEQSIHGGLKPGEIGIVASPNGVGKTSVLVQLALDKLLQGKKVIHVSFTQHTHYVLGWYEDIFDEFTNKKNLENADEIKNEIVKNRVLMSFNQDGVSKEQMIKSLRAMIMDGGFKADSVIIDGYDFSRVEKDSITGVKNFATEMGVSVWYSCSVKDEGNQYDKEKVPLVLGDFIKSIDVVIVLEPKSDHVELSISKDRDSVISKSTAMKLDPKTLLILEV